MFQELLTNLQSAIKQAKIVSGSLNKQLKQSQIQFSKSSDFFHDPTRTLGKAVSFPKSERFKPLEKEQARTSDAFNDQHSYHSEQKQIKGVSFAKSQRFIPQKQDDLTIINPNYQIIMKNNKQAPIIQTPPKSQFEKSRISQITMASQTQVGPGKYFINENQLVKKKNISFSKQKRFSKQKQVYEDTPLYISNAQIKKRPPSMAILKKKTEKNKKQISLQQQQHFRQKIKYIYWKSIPLQLDRLLKKHSNTPVIKQKYFDLKKLTGFQKKCAIFMLLDRLNYQRGGFEHKISREMGDGPCPVRYRKSTPKPFKFSEVEPGPDYYYPHDDLIYQNAIVFTFPKKEEQAKKEVDHRDYEINEEYLRKGGNILIMPEHKAHRLTEQQIRELNRGPGFYDCLFSQVEKRDDIGVVKYQEINEKNARENNCVDIKQVNDGIYFPSYTAIDPKIAGPLYKQPSNVQPMHPPDKSLFPQHWFFYDGNLNKIKAQIAKNIFIGNGLNFQEYQQYTKKYKAFKNYLQRQRRQVEGLEYEPKYDVVDPHVEGLDMAKQSQKTLIDPITKPQFGLDGDNLILSPDKPKPKIANIQFNKMTGHPEDEIGPDDQIEGDILLISPKKMQKHQPEIHFSKMIARPDIVADKNEDDEPMEGDRLVIDPKILNKKIQNIDFSKQMGRQGLQPLENDELKQQLILSPQKKVKIKGFVEMQRMTSVRLVPYLRKKKEQKISVIERKKQKRVQQQQQNNFILSDENNQ